MNDILNEAEAADLLDCTPGTAQEAARRGELPAVKYGRSWRFPRAALLEVLNQRAMANMTKPKTPAPTGIVKGKSKDRQPPALPALASVATRNH